jgi:hypothetical protein
MAYYEPPQVEIHAAPGAMVKYIWGDRTLALHHCATCGCTTHWASIDPNQQDRMGINARMFDPGAIAGVRIRRFDGAETWTFLD